MCLGRSVTYVSGLYRIFPPAEAGGYRLLGPLGGRAEAMTYAFSGIAGTDHRD